MMRGKTSRRGAKKQWERGSALGIFSTAIRGAVVAAIRASLDSADDETKHAALSLPNVAAFSGAVVAAEHDSRAGRCVGKVTAPPHHPLQEQRAPVMSTHAGVLVWWLHCRALAAHKPQVRHCAIAEQRSGCRRATQAVRHASRRSDSTPCGCAALARGRRCGVWECRRPQSNVFDGGGGVRWRRLRV